MKNKKKLSLDKIQIAKLNNTGTIKGGSIVIIGNNSEIITIINCESIIDECETSTKTLPASDSANCMQH